LPDNPSEDEKETIMGILVVAFGVAIVSVVFGGALGFLLGFLGGAVSAAGLVIILRGER
jgi:nitrate reductase NapE component